MKAKIEVTCGSGNVYRDTNRPYADVEQLKAILAAAVIKRLDTDGISVRLMAAINLLGARVEVAVKVRVPRAA